MRDSAGVAAPARPARTRPAPVQNEYRALVGSVLDNRYRLEALIGEGGMGVVFRARHVVIEKPVAVKVLKREVARDRNIVRRFIQEAKAASRIGHPNIVDVNDFGTTPQGLAYSVMEYVDGRTLYALLKEESPLPLWRTLSIVEQMARALAAAHEKGIVHRDLKPENVFVVEGEAVGDFVKIVDFGIAKVLPVAGDPVVSRLTRAGTLFGTPEYMAPEQAAGRADADRRVDIYALGTVFYELVVGRVPHKGESPVRTLAMQMLDAIVPPTQANPIIEVPAGVEAIIMRALAKRREERYPTMRVLVSDIEALAGGIPEWQPLSMSSRAHRLATESGDVAATAADSGPATVEIAGADSGIAAADSGPATVEIAGADSGIAAAADSGPATVELGAIRSPAPPHRGTATAEVTPVPISGSRRSRSRSRAAAVAVILAAAGVVTFVVTRHRGHSAAEQNGLAAAQSAGVAAAGAPPGAARTTRSPPPPLAGAQSAAADAAGPRAAPPKHASGRARATVRVKTRPPGGTLYIGKKPAGRAGTTLRRRRGTRLKVTCKLPGREAGTVTLRFDGRHRVAVCRMARRHHNLRKGKCVKGLKNPFAHCP